MRKDRLPVSTRPASYPEWSGRQAGSQAGRQAGGIGKRVVFKTSLLARGQKNKKKVHVGLYKYS